MLWMKVELYLMFLHIENLDNFAFPSFVRDFTRWWHCQLCGPFGCCFFPRIEAGLVLPRLGKVFLASLTRATRSHIEALEGYTLFLLFHRVNGNEEVYSSNTNFGAYIEHRTILKSGEHLTFMGIQKWWTSSAASSSFLSWLSMLGVCKLNCNQSSFGTWEF